MGFRTRVLSVLHKAVVEAMSGVERVLTRELVPYSTSGLETAEKVAFRSHSQVQINMVDKHTHIFSLFPEPPLG